MPAAAPHTPKALGVDIFFELLEHLSPAGLLTIGRTCKALHRGSIKPLLRQGVTLASFDQLRSFCTFILADVSTRAPLVRTMSLIISEDDGEAVVGSSANIPLPEVLKHMTALETLRIDCADAMFDRIPDFDTAFSQLTTVRTLQMNGMGKASHDAFCKSKFPLRELEIHCQHCQQLMGRSVGDLIHFVDQHQATLERLSAWWYQICGENNGAVFPRIRALALHEFSADGPPTLRQAFPNLRYLELEEGMYWPRRYDPEEFRKQKWASHAGAAGSWDSLSHLCGQLDVLYGLALPPCNLKHVDVDQVGSSPQDLQRLHTLISDTSPSRLMVRTGRSVGLVDFETGKVSALLDVPAAASITHFVLDMLLGHLAGSEDELLDGIETSLSSHHSITFFILRLDKYYSPSRNKNAYYLHPPKQLSWDQKAQGGIARRLASASPSLRYLCLSIMRSPPRYWSVAHVAGEQAVLTELSPMVGCELVREAGLTFHDRSWGNGIPDDI